MRDGASHPLVSFYSGEGTDACGRRLADIWNFSHKELETVHDYIQWLFPLTEPSAFNPDAPLLDDEAIDAFVSSPVLRKNLARSLALMREFYSSSLRWLTPGNHNYLRLTRILTCLTTLGLEAEARALLAWLEELYATHGKVIGERTLTFWRRAVE